jgi:hypothetical protein
VAVNPAVERYWEAETNPRYLRMSYESFVQSPRESLERILELVGESGLALPMRGERTVMVDATHSVAGNESRSARGELTLRLDDEWRHKLPPGQKRLIETLTWPMLVKYGYEPHGRDARHETVERAVT